MNETPSLDPATFDLDAWLEGVQRLRAVVTLYARRDLMSRIDELVAELEPLAEKLRDADRLVDGSLADAGVEAARAESLRAELKYVWEQYEASGVDIELTQLASDDYDEIVKEIETAHPDPAFDASEAEQMRVAVARNELSARLVVLRSVTAMGPHGQPRTQATLTDETLTKITKRFGVDQVGELVSNARSLTLESRVDAPFSRRVSAALAESTSG